MLSPELWRVLLQLNPPGSLLQRGNSNLAKGDPLADFPYIFFYNNEIGKEAPEARGGSLAPLDS